MRCFITSGIPCGEISLLCVFATIIVARKSTDPVGVNFELSSGWPFVGTG